MIYPWPPTFFGLQPSDKPNLHSNIFQLVYYGEGFTFSDVYDMPIYLRNFYLKKLTDTKKEEKKQIDKSNKKSSSTIHKPKFPKR